MHWFVCISYFKYSNQLQYMYCLLTRSPALYWPDYRRGRSTECWFPIATPTLQNETPDPSGSWPHSSSRAHVCTFTEAPSPGGFGSVPGLTLGPRPWGWQLQGTSSQWGPPELEPSTQPVQASTCVPSTCVPFAGVRTPQPRRVTWRVTRPCPASRPGGVCSPTRRHGHSVKYDALTGGEKGDSSIQSTVNTLSKVTEQPVKTRTRSTGLQVCLPDCSNSSKTNSYKKAVSLSRTSRSYCNYLYTFFSQL